MTKWRVEVCQETSSVDYGWVEVEAKTKREAAEIALMGVRDGSIDWDPKSEQTGSKEYYVDGLRKAPA